ncbi:MAG: glycosyltransferase family 39 protein [Syntrophobacteraceae bacterium]|jgi:4-amino-4-deoxy-L-arabinose transferase-like glycosyltransferase
MSWNKRFFLLLALTTVFRLVYLLVAPLDLAGDEAYYWDWSRQLDWGYFSKPPMVAWIIALFSRTIGSSPAVVRLPAVLLGAVSTLALFLLARRMYDSRTAFWAAAAGLASPGASALGFIMTIDAPILCFWSLALYMFWAVLEKRGDGFREWFALAASIGLGLLSKQVMVAFIVLMFAFAVVSRDDRYLLKSRRLYLFSLLGLAALIPDIIWNAHHGWITFHHTAGHFEASLSNFIATSTEFIGGQILIVSPLTWILFALLSALLLFHFTSRDRCVLYLLCFSFVPLLGIAVLSLRQRIQPNWPAVVYPAGMILLAAWGCGNISAGSRLDSWRPYFKKGVIVGAVMALLTYALPFWAVAAPGPWADRLIARLQGWQQLGVEAGRALGEVPRPQSTFILTFNRQLTSELAFYVPGQPRVYTWRAPEGVPENQYDIWDGPKIGSDALIVFPEAESGRAAALSGYFQAVERLDNTTLGAGGRRHYSLYLGTSLKNWPAKKF